MPRFAVTRSDRRIEIAFDDGGVNLLSAAALQELREITSVIRSLRSGQALSWRRRGEGRAGGAAGRSEGPRDLQPGGAGGAEISGSFAALRRSHPTTTPAASPAQDDARLLVFRSAHRHIFAAGADMAEMRNFTPLEAAEFARLGQETFAAIERLPMASVAIIDGDCFGGALDLVMSFDLRFATPRSRFSHPGAKLGIVTGFGGTSRWRKILDAPAARTLFLGNPVLSAAEAKDLGLVDRVGESFDAELAHVEALDAGELQFVKELTNRGERLSRSELLLLAERLGHIYFPTRSEI